MKGLLFVLVIFSITGCKSHTNSSPAKILDKEKMQSVMWDIIGADVFTEQLVKKDSSKNPSLENMQLQNKIFAIHHITRADYYNSFEYYLAHTELMHTIIDSMAAKGERERSKNIEERFNRVRKDSTAHYR